MMNQITNFFRTYRCRGLMTFLLQLCFCTFPLSAQKIISPEQVKAAFQHASDTTSLSGYDKMLDYEEYLGGCPALRKAGNIILPPSNWGFMIEGEYGTWYETHIRLLKEGKEKCVLCWMGFRNPTPEEGKIRRQLKKKYGSIVSTDEKAEGIPAKWLTTNALAFSRRVKYYGGIYATDTQFQPQIRDGYVMLDEQNDSTHAITRHEHDPWNYFDNYTHNEDRIWTLEDRTFNMTYEYLRSEHFEHGQRRLLWRYMEMFLLAYEANKYCPSSFNYQDSHEIKNLPLYIYMRKDGRCEMEVLDDSMLREEDKPYVEELAKALPQMPPLLLPLQFTLDGLMMPGKIIYASRKLAWSFEQLGQDYVPKEF